MLKPNFSFIREYFPASETSGVISLIFFLVPLVFLLYAVENFTAIKLGVFLVLLCWAVFLRIQVTTPGDYLIIFKLPSWAPLTLGIFLFGSLLSFWFAVDRSFAFFGAYHRFTSSIIFFSAWLTLLLILVASLEKSHLNRLLKLAVVAAAINVVFGLLQTAGLSHYIPIYSTGFIRVPGLLGNANFTSMYIAALLPTMVVYLFRNTSRRLKFFGIIGSFLAIWSLVLYNSRGALLGLVVGLIFAGVLSAVRLNRQGFRQATVFICGVLLAIALYIPFTLRARPDSFSSAEQNVSSRLFVWDEAVRLFKEKPVTGWGLGNFQQAYIASRPQYLGGLDYLYDDPHNIFLYLAAEGGILVVGGFVLLLGLTLIAGISEYWKSGDFVLVSALSGIVIWIVVGSFTPVEVANWVLLALLLAIVWVHVPVQEFNVSLPKPFRLGIKVLILFFALVGISVAVSEPLMEYARRSNFMQQHNSALRSAELASVINPTNYIGELNKIEAKIALKENIEELQESIESLASRHPKVFSVQADAGVLFYKLSVRTQSLEHLKWSLVYLLKAQDLNPQDRTVPGMLANIYFILGDANKSKQVTIDNLVLAKTRRADSENWALLARIYRDQGRSQQMVFALDKVYKLEPLSQPMRQFLHAIGKNPDTNTVNIPIDFNPGFFY